MLARVEKLEREKDQEIKFLKEEVLKVQREKNENINWLETKIRKLEEEKRQLNHQVSQLCVFVCMHWTL